MDIILDHKPPVARVEILYRFRTKVSPANYQTVGLETKHDHPELIVLLQGEDIEGEAMRLMLCLIRGIEKGKKYTPAYNHYFNTVGRDRFYLLSAEAREKYVTHANNVYGGNNFRALQVVATRRAFCHSLLLNDQVLTPSQIVERFRSKIGDGKVSKVIVGVGNLSGATVSKIKEFDEDLLGVYIWNDNKWAVHSSTTSEHLFYGLEESLFDRIQDYIKKGF